VDCVQLHSVLEVSHSRVRLRVPIPHSGQSDQELQADRQNGVAAHKVKLNTIKQNEIEEKIMP
jgi:hypothetical protein